MKLQPQDASRVGRQQAQVGRLPCTSAYPTQGTITIPGVLESGLIRFEAVAKVLVVIP